MRNQTQYILIISIWLQYYLMNGPSLALVSSFGSTDISESNGFPQLLQNVALVEVRFPQLGQYIVSASLAGVSGEVDSAAAG